MIYYLTGPTCSGKTEIGLKLAGKIGGEIISADSRQVYRYLTVGTAKPAGAWKKFKDKNTYFVDSVPYHLVDFLQPGERFSAGDFVSRAGELAAEINERGKIPIMLGGTGLYIDSFVYGLAELPKQDPRLRDKLCKLREKHGNDYLHGILSKADAISAANIHPNNTQRLIRALEIYYLTGKPISSWHRAQKKKTPADKRFFFALDYPREILYERINKRAGMMLKNGMIEETRGLIKILKKHSQTPDECPALQSLGYRHIIDFLKNNITFELMKERIQKDTRNYAKRQLTWFRRNKNITWLDAGGLSRNNLVDSILKKSSL